MVGRVDVEADDVADLQLEPRVARDLECPDPVGLEAMALQDAEYRRDGDPHFLRQRPQRPVDRRALAAATSQARSVP